MAGRTVVVGYVSVVLLVPALARAQDTAPHYTSEVMRARIQAEVQQDAQSPPVGPGPGVADPRLLKDVRPRYTPEAMRARIEGQVWLEVVIRKDGTVGDVRVIKSLDAVNGLDQEAITAARGWVFQPARLKATGEAVDYRATIELSFRIFGGAADFERAIKEGTPGLVAPKVRSSVEATFPPDAVKTSSLSTIAVEVVVGEDGRVRATRSKQPLDPREVATQKPRVQSDSLLEALAFRAAAQWTYEPATLNGQAVSAITTISFEVKLPN